MKKKLSDLTTLERHWCLAEVLGLAPAQIETQAGIFVTGDEPLSLKPWNPDTDKALMWDLCKTLNIGDFFEFIAKENKEEVVQLAYIYHKLQADEVEVPDL